ncbi:MAG: ATP-dependent DNA helicase [Candidatus Saccharimonadales bacterium]
MGNTYSQLNAAQKRAVDIVDGSALVVAGAGTGKTRVIVDRILNLIEKGIPAESILALTFTEKAAGEMLDRVSEARGSVVLDTTIATFNGFGHSILEKYGNEWGLGALRLLGETGQLVFLREHLDDFELDYFAPVSNPDGQIKLLSDYVSLLKQQVVLPEDYKKYAEGLAANAADEKLEKQKHLEIARFFETYLNLCRSKGVVDYDDQIYLTIALLKARPNILHELQKLYAYILVDEFQDTNPMQSALIDMLAGANKNIMVVGDDDQSIYGWRGATLANILDFKKRYPAAADVTLIENYRSTQPILDAAYQLIQGNNPDRLEIMNQLDKRLRAQQDKGPTPVARHFSTLDAELAWVSSDVAERLKNGQDAGSIAVLARRNQGVQKMHETLELYDIPHAVAGLSNNIYQEPAVRQLIEALKTVGDPLDDLALYHTLSGPIFRVDASALAELAATTKREHEKLAEVLKASTDETLQSALRTLGSWRAHSHDQTVGALAYQMITDSGWKQHLYEQAENDADTYRQVQALSKYFKTLNEFEKFSGVPSVQAYLVNLETLKAAGSGFEDASLDISDTMVNVLSVHRAKGLEWETVYIIDCTEGSFPMRNYGSSLTLPDELKASQTTADAPMAEERRLMYVAATRARSELILTHADQHGSGAKRKPSRFVIELLGDVQSVTHAEEAQTELELFAPQTTVEAIKLPAGMTQDGKIVLSVSQIASWLECPQDFYYKYVLGMPVPSDPRQQYGTAIHAVIQSIHDGRREGKVPSLDVVLERVRAALPTAGYATARSRERAHAQAIKSATAIYERFLNDPLPIESEQAFAVNIPDLPLKMKGRIDAVYQLEGGVEIRDFKTSTSVTTPEKAKARATSSTQLTLYALAWQLMHDEMPALLTLDFVETERLGSVKKQPKSLETIRAKLQTMLENLQAGVYPAGKDHNYCKHPH